MQQRGDRGGWPERLRSSALLLLVVAAACTSASAAESPASAAQSGALLHEADGRAYRVERVPKAGAKYEWIDAHTVRYYPFARYQVAGQDADYLYIKQYVAAVQKAVATAPLATAAVELAQTHRFGLRDFGRGLPRAGQWREDFALADMDRDGHLDIALAPARKSLARPVILRGDGHGAWARWRDLRFPELPYDYGAAIVADFTGDDLPDLALGMHLRGLTVLAGDGKGGFSRHDEALPLGVPGSPTPPVYSTHQLGTLDWNGDRRPDLIAVNERLLGRDAFGAVSIFVEKRATWSRIALTDQQLPTGNVTLARIAGNRNGVAILVGNAADARAHAYELGAGRIVARSLEGLPAGAIIRASAAADLHGDGKPDLAVAWQRSTAHGWESAIDLYRRSGNGYVRQPLLVEPSLAFGALAFGHLGSARAYDLAALRADGALLLFAADGKGGYTRDHVEPAPDWRAGCRGQALHVRDLDGDGRDDIVAAFAGEPNALMLRRDCVDGGAIAAWRTTDARQD